MKSLRWLTPIVALSLACGDGMGGVSKVEFEAYKTEIANWKTSVQSSGNAVEKWIADAHPTVKWTNENAATICPKCDLPTPPPSPPPDGEW